jgi:hypothetical protein
VTEERITQVETPGVGTHTHTTVVTDEPRRSGAGTWMVLLVILVLGVLGFVIFSQMSGAEVAKDTAIADAANEVGAAAGQVGDAAQDAADTLAQ